MFINDPSRARAATWKAVQDIARDHGMTDAQMMLILDELKLRLAGEAWNETA